MNAQTPRFKWMQAQLSKPEVRCAAKPAGASPAPESKAFAWSSLPKKRNIMHLFVATVVLSFLIVPETLFANITQTIHYQGFLTDKNTGLPITSQLAMSTSTRA